MRTRTRAGVETLKVQSYVWDRRQVVRCRGAAPVKSTGGGAIVSLKLSVGIAIFVGFPTGRQDK